MIYEKLTSKMSKRTYSSHFVHSLHIPQNGPIPEYVLADLYSWLEAHSGLTDSYVTTSASTMGVIKSSLNTNKTSE